MSIHIEPSTVTAVLLADGWHDVTPGTFSTGDIALAPEQQLMYLQNLPAVHNAVWFTMTERGAGRLAGPLTAILAVRY